MAFPIGFDAVRVGNLLTAEGPHLVVLRGEIFAHPVDEHGAQRLDARRLVARERRRMGRMEHVIGLGRRRFCG